MGRLSPNSCHSCGPWKLIEMFCIEKWALTHCESTVKPTMRKRQGFYFSVQFTVYVTGL